MPIVPAPPICVLSLAEDEIRAVRDALGIYVRRNDLSNAQRDASWAVLAEIAHKIRREGVDDK